MRSIDIFRSIPTPARLLSCALLFVSALSAQSLTINCVVCTNGNTMPPATVGVPYNSGSGVLLTASGGSGSYVWSSGGIPPGLSLSSSGGSALLSGVPTKAGTYQVAINATDSGNSLLSQSKSFQLVVATASFSIATPLPGATVGQSYSQTVVSGGTPPYTVSLTSGSVPSGLTLSGTGVLSGTPTAAGTFSFGVQASDSNKAAASGTVTLTISPQALQITTTGTLFNGTVGSAYTTTQFSAQGGTPPYTWSILSGNSDGLTMSSAGILSGTPQSAGSFTFVVQVSDSSGLKTSQTFSLVVNGPSLVITATGSLPSGSVGAAYNQAIATVSGGTSPYSWSQPVGSLPPGLSLAPSGAAISLSGTPTSAGTFTFTLQAADSNFLTASKSFTITIAAATLTITNSQQLPAATLNVAYSQQMTASGGTPPYTWAQNGLPAGLSINSSTGLISGTPTAAGNFPIIVLTVTDSTQTSYRNNFSLSVGLPTPPTFTLSGLSSTAGAATQFPLQVNLSAAYSNNITGQLIIGFQANTGLGDSTIQFSTGGQTANFIVTAGNTGATFLDNNGIPVSQLQIQTGTVAGTISVSLSNVQSAGVDITPVPAPVMTTQIAAAAPGIASVTVTSDGSGGCPKGQLCLQVTGVSTAREVTQAVYAFTAASGQTLQSSANSITVDVSQLFTTWFGTSTIGSQFILNQPFTVQGSPAGVVPVSVTLTNRVGSTTYKISQ